MTTVETLCTGAAVERVRRTVLRQLTTGEPATGAALRRAIATRDRPHLDEALQRLLHAGTITAQHIDRTDTGHGGPGTRYRLNHPAGVTRPRMSTPARRRQPRPAALPIEPTSPLQLREDDDHRVPLVANAIAQARRGEPHDPWCWAPRIQDDIDRARQLVADLDDEAEHGGRRASERFFQINAPNGRVQ